MQSVCKNVFSIIMKDGNKWCINYYSRLLRLVQYYCRKRSKNLFSEFQLKSNTKSKNNLLEVLTLPVHLDSFSSSPGSSSTSSDRLRVPMSLAQTTGFPISWSLSSAFSVFMHRVTNPVDLGVTADRLQQTIHIQFNEQNTFFNCIYTVFNKSV